MCDKEVYVFIFVFRKFWLYFLGCCFIWYIDYMGFQWLRNVCDFCGCYVCWLEEFEEFDFVIWYRLGVLNFYVDVLFCMFIVYFLFCDGQLSFLEF